MSSRIFALLFISVLFGAASNPVQAAVKQYRCFGRVQYRPCALPSEETKNLENESIFSPELASPSPKIFNVSRAAGSPASAAIPKRVRAPGTFARVLTKKFTRGSAPAPGARPDGVWSGTIEGNGTVHLTLHVKRGGILEQSRYMGNIFLKNKSTSFRFVSTAPPGNDWTWDIVADSF